MSGGGGGVIILKIVKDALSVGVTTSGKYKLWHVLAATHVAVSIAGLAIGIAIGSPG